MNHHHYNQVKSHLFALLIGKSFKVTTDKINQATFFMLRKRNVSEYISNTNQILTKSVK